MERGKAPFGALAHGDEGLDQSRSGEGFALLRMIVPPVAWTRATSGLGNLMLRMRPVRRVPLRNLSKSRWCDSEISRRPVVRVPSKAT